MGLLIVLSGPALAVPGGLTPADLWAMVRLGDPQPSPDGRQVAFITRTYSLETNGSASSLWIVAASGGDPKRLTRSQVHDWSPRWLPDSKTLLFLSDRDGSSQIWALRPDGGEPRQVSHLPLDVDNLTNMAVKAVRLGRCDPELVTPLPSCSLGMRIGW